VDQQNVQARAPPRCDVARVARHAHAPTGLGIRTTRRPRPPAGRGVPLPHAPHPEAPWSPLGPRAPRRAVPAQGSPRTTGPSAAPRRTRTGRGSFATVASPSSPRRHQRGLSYKNRVPRPPRAVTAAPPRLPLPAAGELASSSFSSVPNLPTYSLGALETCATTRCSALHPPPAGAAATAGRCHAPSPEPSPLEPRSSPRPR
jgi:hypothetical protein